MNRTERMASQKWIAWSFLVSYDHVLYCTVPGCFNLSQRRDHGLEESCPEKSPTSPALGKKTIRFRGSFSKSFFLLEMVVNMCFPDLKEMVSQIFLDGNNI